MAKPERVLLERIVRAWQALGECEDEFGIHTGFCSEREHQLDDAIAEAEPLIDSRPEALEPHNQAESGS